MSYTSVFDIDMHIPRKEARTIRKLRAMLPYHMARVPLYSGHMSLHARKAQDVRDQIAAIERKVQERWEKSHI